MYEHMRFEDILQRMLARVPGDVDRREGSVIYDALAPAAAEMQLMYIELDRILNEAFADTQSRGFLVRRAGERGLIPTAASRAVLEGSFNVDVPLGSRFSLNELHYRAVERIGEGLFRMECETAGRIGNSQTGTLVPVDYIDGLERAELTRVLVPGEDEEDTEAFRQRYYNSLDSKAFGGNVQDYKEKTVSLPGVGGVKVEPAWKGGGTVHLIIIDSEHRAPSGELLEQVRAAVDPVTNPGKGIGFAPIGHVVTVDGVTEAELGITTQITYQEGWSWEDVRPYAEKAVDQYFQELAQDWADSDNLVVRISQIETRLLNAPGVVDISGTAIDGMEQNLVLPSDAIPKRGELHG